MVKITDGVGNQMFQYAYARTLKEKIHQKVYLDISDINNLCNDKAKESGWVELCDKREYQLNNFLVTLPIIGEEHLSKIHKQIDKKSKFYNYCKMLRLLPNLYLNETDCKMCEMKYTRYQNYYLEGSFFDKSYYENYKKILVSEFRLKKKIYMPDWLEQILENRNTVALHVRRGDFQRIGRNISGTKYYNRALEYINNKIATPFLLVFSDDTEWVKENMKFKPEHLFMSDFGFSDCEELICMSMCKNNVIANSTFSYWGAWLNTNDEKIVIAPRGWRQKIIPNSWVML